jgi:hypothetical protein
VAGLNGLDQLRGLMSAVCNIHPAHFRRHCGRRKSDRSRDTLYKMRTNLVGPPLSVRQRTAGLATTGT